MTTAIAKRVRTNVTDLLTPVEKTDLAALEVAVERGRAGFVEAGTALMEIRERKLYRGTHKTFEAYCVDRWKFGRRYAGLLIEGVKTVKQIEATTENGKSTSQNSTPLPPIENVTQATELAKAPKSERVEAWVEATKTTTSPTAKDVRAAVNKVKTKPKVDPKDPPLVPACVEAREAIVEFKELQADIQKLRKAMKALCDRQVGRWINAQQVDADLKNVWNALKFHRPYGPCPCCAQKGCKACREQGWVPVGVVNNLPPEHAANAVRFKGTDPE